MNEVKTYKCPCCDAPLVFDPKSGEMKCEHCDTKFSAKDAKEYIDAVEAERSSDSYAWDSYTRESGSGDWSEDEKASMRTYVCPSCGGEIVGDQNTVATLCPYCGNPTIIADNAREVYKPDVIIPFKFSIQQAKDALKKHYRKKPLLPSCFKEQNKIEEIKGIYVPFWFFDCNTDSSVTYNATRVRTWRDSDYIYTETSHYLVRRDGTLDFQNVPADGSSKIDDTVMQSIEPFNENEMVEFSSNYLSGFLADKYDVDAEDLKPTVNERVKQTVTDMFKSTVIGYNTVSVRSANMQLTDGRIKYGLMPIYFLNTKYKDKTYTFAMNGQTGKLVGDLPIAWGKFFGYFAGVFASCMALFGALMLLW